MHYCDTNIVQFSIGHQVCIIHITYIFFSALFSVVFNFCLEIMAQPVDFVDDEIHIVMRLL